LNTLRQLLHQGHRRFESFWHEPIRRERLDAVRICVAIALLSDVLIQYVPHLAFGFGPTGTAPAGVNDHYVLHAWRWPMMLFPETMGWIWALLGLWVTALILMLVGYRTRWAIAAVWLLTFCFLAHNPNIRNGGDDTLQVVLFLLMLAPCGRSLSLDARGLTDNRWAPAWPVRLIQLQLCAIYLTTGLAKLRGGMWWDGSSMYYVFNDVTLTRWSYAQLPVPYWITVILTYLTVWWEVLFLPLMLWKRTRVVILLMGLAMHIGVFISLEVGWFSIYTMAMYAAWIPDSWWAARDKSTPRSGLETQGIGDGLGAALPVEASECG
jgi:hypothetical protein